MRIEIVLPTAVTPVPVSAYLIFSALSTAAFSSDIENGSRSNESPARVRLIEIPVGLVDRQ